ncbi:meiosis protein mei2 [Colletotrichum truncatum]|uniref:Meiosis protein mei2 n=1 Tax=Colletotrichum truncatum TaxID=5467 RepID=A0ACC3YIA8_COLTU|nr:meiosis protein mei2 [Colletotrichum truncatum]KAF6794554.1 meiosis protein mei2 [Colletotrichum truncatum]
MAHPHELRAYNPSSPQSSTGAAESFKGTPDTKLTAFSPEEGSSRSSRLLKPLGQDHIDIAPPRLSINAFSSATVDADKDPFITAISSTALQRLSPTASTFQPFVSPLGRDYHTVTPDSQTQTGTNLLPTGHRNECKLSQCLCIGSPGCVLAETELTSCFMKLQLLGLMVDEPRQIYCKNGEIFVQFRDIRDAVLVHDNLHRTEAGFEAKYIPEIQFFEGTRRDTIRYGCCVSILAMGLPPGLLDVSRLETALKCQLQSKSQLYTYHTQQGYEPGTYEAIVQFKDPSEAMSAVFSLDNMIIEGARISFSFIDANDNSRAAVNTLNFAAKATGLSHTSQDFTGNSHALAMPPNLTQMPMALHGTALTAPASSYTPLGIQVPSFKMWPIFCQSQFQPNMAYVVNGGHHLSLPLPVPHPNGYQIFSPLFPHQPRMSTSTTTTSSPKPELRRQNAARVNRAPYYSVANHHNHVDVNRIREGTDVRTTIMLRNIPNKVDQAMLKRIVDESSWGKYDFMYLRIDFANDCNVGYAFINFVDPLDIIDFVNTRGNQRWNCFKSDKVAEISYATIQGKDCLVQKFRNSSVMLEAAHYRPKLFYTSNGPLPELAGEEEPFPHPDNQSKMKRSCENAEHVGLFTPNAGQHFRDEQRRRRSQYDRGTRLAALEEHDFEANLQPRMYHA